MGFLKDLFGALLNLALESNEKFNDFHATEQENAMNFEQLSDEKLIEIYKRNVRCIDKNHLAQSMAALEVLQSRGYSVIDGQLKKSE